MRVARKGIVEPPEHRHAGIAQGPEHPPADHGVDNDEIGAEGQPPQSRGGNTPCPGDNGGTGVPEQLQRTVVTGAQHRHFIAHAAEHGHGAHHHDGGTRHIQHMADEECPLAVERIGVLGADVPLKMEQSLRDAGAPLAQAGGSVQQFADALRVLCGGAAAVQQSAGHQRAAGAGDVGVALVEGGGTVVAEHGVAEDEIRPVFQGGGKVVEGGGHQLYILPHQQHTGHGGGESVSQRIHQPEFLVELVAQGVFQRHPAARGINKKIEALRIGINLPGQLGPLQGTVTAVHECCRSSVSDGCAQRLRWNQPSRRRNGEVMRQLLLDSTPSSDFS